MNVKERATCLSPEIVAWRRELHQIPEVGLNCPKTAAYICARLKEMGIEYRTYEKHSGIVALIGGKGGKVVGLRADMDGLNVKEDNNLAYASQNGAMHACGHDGHTAILLGAAKMLKEVESELNGRVKLIFQPDEEGLMGAKAMIADGVCSDPPMDCMYALHVGSIVGRGNQRGDLLYKTGTVFASSDVFRVVIHGKGGHASAPDKAVSPVLAAVQYITNIQGLVGREVAADVPTVLSITSLRAGNGSINIIPDTAEIVGGLRTQDPQVRDHLLAEMKEILNLCARQFHVTAEFEILVGCPPTVNDKKVTEQLLRSAQTVLKKENLIPLPSSSMGGEDCSFFFSRVPGCYVCLYNSCASDDGAEYPHHNSRFCMDDSVLYLGSAVFVQAVLDFLNEEPIQKEGDKE